MQEDSHSICNWPSKDESNKENRMDAETPPRALPRITPIVDTSFPYDSTTREQLRFLIEFAVRAPSGHNTQPWLFRLTDNHLDVIADRTRALPVVDPFDRELTISCGAAIDHMAVAASHFGREILVGELPDPADSDVLARISLGKESLPTDRNGGLFESIPHRITTRAAFEAKLIPDKLADRCTSAAEERGIELTLILDRADRMAIGELVAEGDRIQFADPRFRRELALWIHSRRSSTQDGMSGSAFGIPDVLSPIGALAIRTFDLGKGVAAGDRNKITDGSPALAVFSSPGDEPHDWLKTGEALSRVLLTLTASGALASYLNQPIEVQELRHRLKEQVGCDGVPQLLMRLGYGKACSPSIRRSVDEVLIS